ncbi:hypothetical protein CERSUDRAFT_110381 [Gelatoporia subvermispora B]|uniref:DH domain-containing protein n=1 Tax=Ceriporiopsis subvermispora (strain B) TaxID=914234 RepID=M2RBI4_CERS8|nr:hypothetical protein CERSUDRAFT_110381 [Gelatoporia subvermispora B]
MPNRPRAPTPSHHPTPFDDCCSDSEQLSAGISPSSAYVVDSPNSMLQSPNSPAGAPHFQPAFARSASEEDSAVSDSGNSYSSGRSPQVPALPDPSQFPDPYPYRPPHWLRGTSTPALSSADSSSASTRSSAYTNSARSGDYGHVHVALEDEEHGVGVGITTDDVVQLLARDSGVSSSATQGRAPVDQSRWSDLYANSIRSRSSSVGNTRAETTHEAGTRILRGTPSFDLGWQPVDERDEVGLTSEDDTDDDVSLDGDDQEEDEQSTNAVVIAEEGRGIIVQGDDAPIVRLQVHPGTTHLLIGSSSTPNAVPSFLANTLPQITSSLLALDISANFLGALPPSLAACVNLEELNIASNPLRALPVFLANLTSLRVLIVDSTGINTLPNPLCALDKLHTLSIRRNKLNSLPSWLCLLPALETLLVDGNPFQGPWRALMEPLLAKTPMTPLYPPSTPMFPLPSASIESTASTNETDPEDSSDLLWSDRDNSLDAAQQEEDTITPARAPPMARAATAPSPNTAADLPSPGLSRTRTTPNRAFYDKSKAAGKASPVTATSGGLPSPSSGIHDGSDGRDREVRKMKSAGDLRRGNMSPYQGTTKSTASSPLRPAMSEYVTSASSSDLLSAATGQRDSQVLPKRFASLGVTSSAMAGSMGRARRPTINNMWDTPAEDENEDVVSDLGGRGTPALVASPQEMARTPPLAGSSRGSPPQTRVLTRDDKGGEKTSRWGFLKKMSMGKMRQDSPNLKASPAQTRSQLQANTRPGMSRMPVGGSMPNIPQIDVRISTTGTLLNSAMSSPNTALPPSVSRKPSAGVLKGPSALSELPSRPQLDGLQVPSNNLLVPPTPRSGKRRSFLPIDMSPIPIPAAAPFVNGLTATNSTDDDDRSAAPSPVPPSPIPVPSETLEGLQRREEERQREARIRALRSVMAYLRDMHDLGLSQSNTTSVYGSADTVVGLRSRRPTIAEGGRMPSESSTTSLISPPVSRPESVGFQSSESRGALRSGSTTQTNSVATTDSAESGGERKFKDEPTKRARIIREIVETEQTYVKGLQELVDIYITPACAPVTALGGVGQGKDSVVPAAERKIVFGGLEALFIFHKDSFLPALKHATAPLLDPQNNTPPDAVGLLSLDVARKVAQTFVGHAAFMKMYSTYINNFDNSVSRIRTWTSDRQAPTPTSTGTLSPSSSSAQLASLGAAMSAVSAPGVVPDGAASNVAPLSSSQRKRIRTYLKRCRMNPRHSQLNLEGYLLLPVQRIPRYRLLLEELVRSTPPLYAYMEDPLDRALTEISSLANNMNEGKRESESRRKLVQWQARIRGKFPSPLVQPHRRLIMDGTLHLTRVVRKTSVSFEVINAQGDASSVQVECLSPELTPRSLVGILCNDLLVLCRDPSEGQDPHSAVDLWAVLRMQTLPQPASIVHGNALRLVDNKAILYFNAPSTSDALNWFRAINLHIPASKA